jgi:hypothetical protein
MVSLYLFFVLAKWENDMGQRESSLVQYYWQVIY